MIKQSSIVAFFALSICSPVLAWNNVYLDTSFQGRKIDLIAPYYTLTNIPGTVAINTNMANDICGAGYYMCNMYLKDEASGDQLATVIVQSSKEGDPGDPYTIQSQTTIELMDDVCIAPPTSWQTTWVYACPGGKYTPYSAKKK